MCYNAFETLDMTHPTLPQAAKQIASPLEAIASPERIAILLAIGTGEACVCHLEAALGWRQAYISQHLMALRKADIVRDRRQGRYIYYRLTNASLLELVLSAARLSGLSAKSFLTLTNRKINPSCECPECATVSASPGLPVTTR